jgi:hypothetical protein
LPQYQRMNSTGHLSLMWNFRH